MEKRKVQTRIDPLEALRAGVEGAELHRATETPPTSPERVPPDFSRQVSPDTPPEAIIAVATRIALRTLVAVDCDQEVPGAVAEAMKFAVDWCRVGPWNLEFDARQAHVKFADERREAPGLGYDVAETLLNCTGSYT